MDIQLVSVKETGISHITIRRGIRYLGLEYKFLEFTEWTADRIEELQNYVEEGMLTIPEIAKRMGLTSFKVRGAISKYKLPYDLSKVRKNIHNKFYKMFIEGMSIDEISNSTGFSWNTVYRRLIDEFKSHKEFHRMRQSLGERNIMIALDRLNIKYTREKTYSGLIQSRDYFRIDYEIVTEDGTIFWIEYNGEQHYKNGHFYESMNENEKIFKSQVQRDLEVKEYAFNNNIVFVEIPYTVTKMTDIINILNKVILERKDPKSVVELPNIEL